MGKPAEKFRNATDDNCSRTWLHFMSACRNFGGPAGLHSSFASWKRKCKLKTEFHKLQADFCEPKVCFAQRAITSQSAQIADPLFALKMWLRALWERTRSPSIKFWITAILLEERSQSGSALNIWNNCNFCSESALCADPLSVLKILKTCQKLFRLRRANPYLLLTEGFESACALL